ncbi:MAG: anaerobic ribonucleoside-triphosphate reductase activating protein [Syntrophales bacterium]|jgi:pyruvate formate lyase activating enzyme|nr:anaerobic ribonucleoside-triphosphate reductase activating protein [Syntrophales bacterium]MCK9528572.1 anaerobic ribonucleoside-triphosphate reductase activating protein [Syntrophales bacterium]MDX9922792.1 anaerobic ribonucleoside-triphosphate reductase activating protein [Syntrophales bacterium]
MDTGYLQKFSLIDYPGRICAVLFAVGCNFRCPWCHNPDLVRGFPPDRLVPVKAVLEFLETRRGKLEGVTITGGEPTLQGERLSSLAAAVKDLGFAVKVDTNGSRPAVLRDLAENGLVDYIAMDVKGPREAWPILAGGAVDYGAIDESIDFIMTSGVDYEFRTTLVGHLLTPDDIERAAERLAGAGRYVLQRFVPSASLDPDFPKQDAFTGWERAAVLERVRRWVPSAFLR